MGAFLYGLGLQWKLDIRSKTMLITCYMLPLLFFVFMGGIFTSINPEAKNTLIQSMCIFGVSMGALIGLPPSLVEIYSSDIKNVYKANGIPMYSSVVTHFVSALIHLLFMCTIILGTSPILFDTALPSNLPMFYLTLFIFIATTLSIGCILGLVLKNMAKLTMISQLVFMPSLMLSGIMFPTDMLPSILKNVGKAFPATWAFLGMTDSTLSFTQWIPMLVVFVISVIICGFVLAKKKNL